LSSPAILIGYQAFLYAILGQMIAGMGQKKPKILMQNAWKKSQVVATENHWSIAFKKI
jgi:hypothetical protein